VAAQAALLATLPNIEADDAATCCWACGIEVGAMIERCHLVPFASGNDEPGNIVLLCRACHRDQPDRAPLALQLAWLRSRPSFGVRLLGQCHETINFLALESGADFPEIATALAGVTPGALDGMFSEGGSDARTNALANFRWALLGQLKTRL
jgi:hypothetical protein